MILFQLMKYECPFFHISHFCYKLNLLIELIIISYNQKGAGQTTKKC